MEDATDAVKVADELGEVKYLEEVFDATKASNKQKGNFGEIKAADNLVNNQALKDAGYNLTRIGDAAPTGLNDKIVKGIDGLYENATPPPKFVIDEAKYGTSQLGKTKDGKQMSDGWIKGSERLEKQVGDRAREIERTMKNGEVEKVLSKIDKNGNVVTKKLGENGNIIGNWP